MSIKAREVNDLDPGNYEGRVQAVTHEPNDSPYDYLNIEFAVQEDEDSVISKDTGVNVTDGISGRGHLGSLLKRCDLWDQVEGKEWETHGDLCSDIEELLLGKHFSFTVQQDEQDPQFTRIVNESITPIQRDLEGNVA